MGWGKFDDRYPSNRKVRPLSDAAFRLDVSAILWCNSQLTDGRIETDELPLVSDVKQPAKAAAELVRRGRWHLAGDGCGTDECPKGEPGEGWQIHDHLEFNESKAAVLARREADRNRKKRPPKGTTPPQPPAGFQPESERSPNGIQSASGVDSARIPSDPSRMPAGARAQARAPSRPVLTEVQDQDPPVPSVDAHEREGRMSDLVDAVRAVRPFWNPAEIAAAAGRCAEAGRPYKATRDALIAVADDPATVRPSRVVADGPWWRPPVERGARSTTDDRVGAALAIADQLDAEERRTQIRALPGGAS